MKLKGKIQQRSPLPLLPITPNNDTGCIACKSVVVEPTCTRWALLFVTFCLSAPPQGIFCTICWKVQVSPLSKVLLLWQVELIANVKLHFLLFFCCWEKRLHHGTKIAALFFGQRHRFFSNMIKMAPLFQKVPLWSRLGLGICKSWIQQTLRIQRTYHTNYSHSNLKIYEGSAFLCLIGSACHRYPFGSTFFQ